jgi:hypothetical protein
VLEKARTGDEILIRHTGLLPLKATAELPAGAGPAGEFRVKFRPDRGHAPVLTAPGGDRLDQTLFKLMGGEVAFEGVHFLLRPSRPRNGQTVTAVSVVGGRGCTFKNCVFTLAEEDESRAAAVLIDDPSRTMAMDAGVRPVPAVRFENCLSRGRGRGVWVPVSRAVEVDAANTLTALDGPVFLAEAGAKPAGAGESHLRLVRVTALAGGPVVELRGGKAGAGEMRGSGLVKLGVQADECLFAGVPNAGRPLVELDGIDPASEDVLAWRTRRANRYANFDPDVWALVARPEADAGPPKEWDWDKWVGFAGEPPGGKPVGKVTFARPPGGLRDLATLQPADATVKDVTFPELADAKPGDAGADVSAIPAADESRPD